MTIQAIAISSLISLTVLFFFFFQFYPTFLLDSFRQRIFAIRRGLFERAAEGEISFDEESYKVLRMKMNSVIRFAHQMSLFHFWLFMRQVKNSEMMEQADVAEKNMLLDLEKLSSSERELILHYQDILSAEVFRYMILRSPFFSLFLGIKNMLGSYLNPDFRKIGEKKTSLKEYNKKAVSIVFSQDISERQSLYAKVSTTLAQKAA